MSPLTKRARLAAAVAAPLLLSGATLTATAPAASAAPTGADACTHPGWSNKSPGKGTAKGGDAKVRTGPSQDCAVTATVGTSVVLQYHCWVQNSAGNKWTHVRIDGTQINGWVYNGNLDDGGSVHPDNKC
ncbi:MULTISPECIES: SH3 domain-containing protein [Streptomyces]|uniref:SH3 domain-containing protein n=1 Tax=Streptomyces TaxID=1883 RepID=UPI000A9ABE6F|nr:MULTISPECIES: SH3 domain-containing protein [Streptomyces]